MLENIHLLKESILELSNKYEELQSKINDQKIDLIDAVRHNDMIKTQLALKYTDVNAIDDKNHSTSLLFASQLNSYKMVKFLIENGADTNFRNKAGMSALMYTKDFKIFKLLVENNANINHVDWKGQSVLMYVVKYGNMDILNFLLTKDVNVNHVDNDYKHTLTYSKSLEIFKLLEENGADIYYINSIGQSLLMIIHTIEIFKYLTESRIDINYVDNYGKNALMFIEARSRDNESKIIALDMCRMLIEKGINVDHKDKLGYKASYYMQSRKVKKYVRSHESKRYWCF